MHVDGFRFDLASALARDGAASMRTRPLFTALRADPALANVKLIRGTVGRDADGYALGRYPAPWPNERRYRDDVRRWWRGEAGASAPSRAGSSALPSCTRGSGRGPTRASTFVTAHDALHAPATFVSYEAQAQ